MHSPHLPCFGRTIVLAAVCALAGLLVPMASAAPQAAPDCHVADCHGELIDFNSIPTGTIVSTVFGSGNSGPITVRGYNRAFGLATNAAVVFDSAHPTSQTGNDDDLGSPNETFGGPGVGLAGEENQPFENEFAQCRVLIIDETLIDVLPGPPDGLVDLPDDADNPNASFSFDFSAVGPVTVFGLTVIDVEAEEASPAMVEFLDAGDSPVAAPALISATGDNGVERLDFGDGVSGVVRLVVTLGGSGAIDDICFEPDQQPECTGEIGDFVWLDENSNGIQDAGEPGIQGVQVVLLDHTGQFITSNVTGPDGSYLFQGLCHGCYQVGIRRRTVPEELEATICKAGGNTSLDSNCIPVRACLPQDDSSNRSIDFGFKRKVVADGEGCSHGYWKVDQHHDSWPAPYVATGKDATLFSDVFDPAFGDMTLLEVLEQGGGGLNALGREAAAALLNAASGVSYGLSIADVVTMFNELYPQANSNNYEPLKDLFEGLNTQGCPLN